MSSMGYVALEKPLSFELRGQTFVKRIEMQYFLQMRPKLFGALSMDSKEKRFWVSVGMI